MLSADIFSKQNYLVIDEARNLLNNRIHQTWDITIYIDHDADT